MSSGPVTKNVDFYAGPTLRDRRRLEGELKSCACLLDTGGGRRQFLDGIREEKSVIHRGQNIDYWSCALLCQAR